MMKKQSLFLSLAATVVVIFACSDSSKPSFQTAQLMTGQDVLNSSYSNISITNGTDASVRSSGLFIASFDSNDCSACFGSIMSGNNAFGALVEPVSFAAGQSIRIGQNYLYNLIYNGINDIVLNVSSSPCLLPGCSWPGDSTTLTGWCLSIGVMSLNSNYTSSTYVNADNSPASAVPYGEAVASTGFHYDYNLIDPSTLGSGGTCLGPIVCNDETLTCSVTTAQSQTFQSY